VHAGIIEPGHFRFTVNGEPVTTQGKMELAPGDVVRMELPGGGGYGEPGT